MRVVDYPCSRAKEIINCTVRQITLEINSSILYKPIGNKSKIFKYL